MGTQAQNAAAARARAARWHPEPADTPEPSDNEESLVAMLRSPILLCIDSDSDDDCGYTGGVNVCLDLELEEGRDGSDDEHRMFWWIEAYRSGLGTWEAQVQVQNFSSTKYKSHRRIPEDVASAFD